MTNFPKLYKKSSLGKIEVWEISIKPATGDLPHMYIVTSFGELEGKLQVTSDTIKEGKNIGRSNETTVVQQAFAEAKSKWEKKLKSGYVDTLEKAQAGVTDDIIEGGGNPMLAHDYSEHGHKITKPCAGQPKLDGVRDYAVKVGDNVTLWTRTRKRITSCPHIEEAIRTQVKIENCKIDGELYNHELKNDFNKIISAVRKVNPSEESLKVQFHIYDLDIPEDFETRNSMINSMIEESEHIKIVETVQLESDADIKEYMSDCLKAGYEGIMLRNWESYYENKRSYNLQKYKEFKSDEFRIIGAEEGRGKLQGHLGAFLCTVLPYDPKRDYKKEDPDVFGATMAVPQDEKKEFWENSRMYIGSWLEVKYFELTPDLVPRFPVGMRIRYPDRGL